jgi:hypothetical protein
MTVWICVDTSKQVGDKDHLKVFAWSHVISARTFLCPRVGTEAS